MMSADAIVSQWTTPCRSASALIAIPRGEAYVPVISLTPFWLMMRSASLFPALGSGASPRMKAILSPLMPPFSYHIPGDFHRYVGFVAVLRPWSSERLQNSNLDIFGQCRFERQAG